MQGNVHSRVSVNNKIDTKSPSKLRTKAELNLVITQEEMNRMIGTVVRECDVTRGIADLKAFVSRQQVAKPARQITQNIVSPLPIIVSLISIERKS